MVNIIIEAGNWQEMKQKVADTLPKHCIPNAKRISVAVEHLVNGLPTNLKGGLVAEIGVHDLAAIEYVVSVTLKVRA